MPQNYVNKFIINGTTRLDLSEDTVTPATLASGITAHDAEGKAITGTLTDEHLIVTLSWDDNTEKWVSNKTFSEIQTAYNAGYEILVKSAYEEDITVYGYYDVSSFFYYVDYTGDTNERIFESYVLTSSGLTLISKDTYIYPNFESKTKSYIPSETTQSETVTYDSSTYNGLQQVSVSIAAISSNYVGSNVARKSSSDLIVSGPTITAPAGYYQSNAAKTVAAGSLWSTIPIEGEDINVSIDSSTGIVTAIFVDLSGISGSPVRTDGWLTTNDTVSITPQEYGNLQLPTQAAATITPSTTSQTAVASGKYTLGNVTVAAIPSQYIIPSGTKEISISSAGSKVEDVTAYASAKITTPAGSATTPAKTITANPTLSIDSNGLITGSVSGSSSITPTVSAGYVSSGTAGTVSVSGSSTLQLTKRTSTDLTANASTITAPSGYYPAAASKSVQSGSATGPSSISSTGASVSTGSNTVTFSKTGVSTTPTVSAGYISNATSSTATVSLTASVTTKAAATITPTTTAQTIASGTYLTGTQTISGDSNLVAGNIKKDVSIFGVTGTYEGSGGGGGSAVVVVDEQLPGGGTAKHITAVDLSNDTVDAAHLATGYTAHDSSGNAVLGTMSGGSSVKESDVNFIDYDGTIVYSYTKSEFASLSALPSNPSHTGLTAQGWNWTLSDAKTYVATYGRLWIGQSYVTSSGDTEIDVELKGTSLSPYLGLGINGTVTIDWGDNTATDTVTGSNIKSQKRTFHTYASAGKYTISIHVTSGTCAFYGTTTYPLFGGNYSNSNAMFKYARSVTEIRIGSGLTIIGNYAFYRLHNLHSVAIPTTVTQFGTYVADYAFSLKSITVPSTVTGLDTGDFQYAYSLQFISLPKDITEVPMSAFAYCNSLENITIPSTVTSLGGTAFQYCNKISRIDGIDKVSTIGNNAFYNCYNLQSVDVDSATTIGNNAFYNCQNLPSVDIDSATTIGGNAFQYCYSITNLTIPSTVTDIAANAFGGCYGLNELHFKPASPPTVANSNAFTNVPTTCIIYVPTGKLSAYTSASNYPSSSTYTYVEE